jgi:hypothetical protein
MFKDASKKSAISKVSGAYGYRWIDGEVKRTIDCVFKFFEDENGQLILDKESQDKFNALLDMLNNDLHQASVLGLVGRKFYASFFRARTIQTNSDATKSQFDPALYFADITAFKVFRNFLRDSFSKGKFDSESLSPVTNSPRLLDKNDPYALISIRVSGVVYCTISEDKNDIVADKLLAMFDQAVDNNKKPKLCTGDMITELVNRDPHQYRGQHWIGIYNLQVLQEFITYLKTDLPRARLPWIEKNMSLCAGISAQLQECANSMLTYFSSCLTSRNSNYANLEQPQNSGQISPLKSRLLVTS